VSTSVHSPGPWSYAADTDATTLEMLALLRELRTALNALVAQGVLAQSAVQDTTRARERLQALLDFIYETRRRHEQGQVIELDAVWARLSVDLCQLLEYCGGPANQPATRPRTHTGALAPTHACR